MDVLAPEVHSIVGVIAFGIHSVYSIEVDLFRAHRRALLSFAIPGGPPAGRPRPASLSFGLRVRFRAAI